MRARDDGVNRDVADLIDDGLWCDFHGVGVQNDSKRHAFCSTALHP